MRFVIVTGMSGAGKSSVLKMLEDAGYFCVDNLPVPLILKFAEISWHEENMMSKVALGIDIRSRNHLNMLEDVLKSVRDEGYDYEILFMDCKDDKLIKRYKETRRNHPLAAGGRIETAIAEERQRLSFLKKQSDYIIDTSNLLIRDLKKEIQHIFVEDKDYSNFYITLLSFGFKYGIPADADLVFDVRFLPNPRSFPPAARHADAIRSPDRRPSGGKPPPARADGGRAVARTRFPNGRTARRGWLRPAGPRRSRGG